MALSPCERRIMQKISEGQRKRKGACGKALCCYTNMTSSSGIFFISSLFMVNVTVIDYMMKLLAKTRYEDMYPEDPEAATRAFASFMGYFGQTNISFLFSSLVQGRLLRNWALQDFDSVLTLLLVCTVVLWTMPTIWCVFVVIKGMSCSLNNPTKEILYQATHPNKIQVQILIDTFGQRSAKAPVFITNAFASSLS